MYKYLLIGLSVSCIMACNKETPTVRFDAPDFDGRTAFIVPSGKFKTKLTHKATVTTTGGTVSQDANDTLVFVAPNAVGIHSIVAVSADNPKDTIFFKFVVTPRPDIFKAIQRGGYVLVFRHTAADIGTDQTASVIPNWWKLCQAGVARQLNPQGMKDAADIGKVLKASQIAVERVFSSEFCRCVNTAELMAFDKTIQTHKDLTFYVYDEANRYANTMKLVENQPLDSKNTVMVTHAGFTGTIPSPAPINSLNWGDAAVFKLSVSQPPSYVTTITVTDFTSLVK